MLLVSARDLTRQFGARPVFSGLSCAIHSGERIGLVGPNGAGKTTLLRLVAGLDTPEIGSIERHGETTVGLLEQEPLFQSGRTLFEEARSAFEPLERMQAAMLAAADRLAHTTDTVERRKLEREYAHLEERLRQLGAYHLDHRVERVLGGVGFTETQHGRPVESFSGGEQCRLMLARLLLASPDVLLMDEPSNHLDIDGTRWLEEWLPTLPQGMLIVSHDRYFLDRVATRIFELQDGRITVYNGNFSDYQKQRAERMLVQERTYEQQQAYIADQQDFIRRYHYGQRAAQAKDREKKLERIQQQRVERPRETAAPVMGFAEAGRSGDVVLDARELGKAFDRPLFSDLSLTIERGDRLGIIGPNGCGKTTLLRVLVGLEPPTSGTLRRGHRVAIGYYDQKLENLPLDQTAIRAAWPPLDPDATEGSVRSLLARFGITGERAFQQVGSLSGGEKSRVALLRLVVSRPNVLVMDEPTNHLDLWARDALERSLDQFEGTVIAVSHDRYFLNRVARRLLVLGGARTRLIEGNYDRYQEILAAEAAGSRPDPRARTATPARPGPPRAARKRRFAYRKAADIEREIAAAEQELAAAEARMADPALYQDGDEVKGVRTQHDELKTRLATLYAWWEEAAELNG